MYDAKTKDIVIAIPTNGKVTAKGESEVCIMLANDQGQFTEKNLLLHQTFRLHYQTYITRQFVERKKLALFDAILKNKREFTFLVNKQVGKSLFAFDRNKSLVSYAPICDTV